MVMVMMLWLWLCVCVCVCVGKEGVSWNLGFAYHQILVSFPCVCSLQKNDTSICSMPFTTKRPKADERAITRLRQAAAQFYLCLIQSHHRARRDFLLILLLPLLPIPPPTHPLPHTSINAFFFFSLFLNVFLSFAF